MPVSLFLLFNDTPPAEIYTLSLHDALPILLGLGPRRGEPLAVAARRRPPAPRRRGRARRVLAGERLRSEEHTSELQSRQYLVCRLLLEKKKSHTITASCAQRPLLWT